LGDFSNDPGYSYGDSYEYIKLSGEFLEDYREESIFSGYSDYRDKNSSNELDNSPTYEEEELVGYHD
jgi:hypothetical protein